MGDVGVPLSPEIGGLAPAADVGEIAAEGKILDIIALSVIDLAQKAFVNHVAKNGHGANPAVIFCQHVFAI